MVERFTLLTKGDRVIGFVDNKNDEHLGELSMMKLANQLSEENEKLKQCLGGAIAMARNPTQHNLWRFRTICKENGVDV